MMEKDLSLEVSKTHLVTGHEMHEPFASHLNYAIVGMGCFWGVERLFWQLPGVYSTQVGYAGGNTEHPTYKEICYKQTGHAEVVRIIFDPSTISYRELLTIFWEKHNPTQGMRQGNDVGSQYRSLIMTFSDAQANEANETKQQFQQALNNMGSDTAITTEILPASEFYYAEDYHQQYLEKNPNGYCGLKGTGACLI